MSKAKEDGLRVSLCHKYVRAVTGKPPGKGNSPVKMAYRLLQETDGPRRGTKSINQYLDDCSDLMKQTIGGVKPKVKKAEKPEFLESFAWRSKNFPSPRQQLFFSGGQDMLASGG